MMPSTDRSSDTLDFQAPHASRRMKPIVPLLAALWLLGPAHAQSPAPAKIAIVSLIGDTMTIDTYRRRVGTGVDFNHQEQITVGSPVFDHAALAAAADAVAKALPGASVAPLAVPAAGSAFDPAGLVEDGELVPSNPLVAALQRGGYSHLLAITRHRGIARLQLADITVGSGYLRGIGFYIDPYLGTKAADSLRTARGFVAPYVYIKLLLVELSAPGPALRGERAITASVTRSGAGNDPALDPWESMTAEEKVSTLKDLLNEQIDASVPLLLQAR